MWRQKRNQDRSDDPRVEAIRRLVRFSRDLSEQALDDRHAERLILLTTMRSTNTALAISNLLVLDSIEQAQMLCRSLFEDAMVAHWLVMQEDTDFLVKRFFASQEAIALARQGINHDMRFPSQLPGWLARPDADRRDELRKEFGDFAQRPWWGARADGPADRSGRGRRRD